MAQPDLSLWSDPNISIPLINDSTSQPILDTSNHFNSLQNGLEPNKFVLDQVQFELPSKLIHFACSNNVLALLLESGRVLVVDLLQAHDILDLDLPGNKGSVYKIFIDPGGNHFFVSTSDQQLFYYHVRLTKFKLIGKMSGHLIESVAWDKTISIQKLGTGDLLLGTSEGLLFELRIEPSEEYFKKEEKWVKLVYKLPNQQPITGLYYEQFPATLNKYLVMLTTPTRLYQFIGSSTSKKGNDLEPRFPKLFSNYEKNITFQEIPGDLSYSNMLMFSKFGEIQLQSVASSFAWLTASGIYHGDLVFGSQKPGESVIENANLTPYPSNLIPLSISITQFHFILLYKEKILVLSKLDNQLVFDDKIPNKFDQIQFGVGLIMDSIRKTFWIHTGNSIYELIITDEDRDVWKYYLNSNQFTEALQYAKKPGQKNKILTTQADHYFQSGRYQLSASYYGKSNVALEDIASKFIEKKEMDALRSYLLIKLDHTNKKDMIQTILLCTWLVELYLSKINSMEDIAISLSKNNNNNLLDNDSQSSHYLFEETNLMIKEFHHFLNSNKLNLDPKITYDLMSSFGRTEELVYFAELINDTERVVGHYCMIKKFKMALDSLSKQDAPSLYYKFSPQLIDHVPEELVTLLMRNTQLDPKRLIPALLKYDPSKYDTNLPNQAIRYLQFVIQKLKCKDVGVHNLLLSLLAAKDGNESQLLQFIASEEYDRFYSLDYALRLCTQYQRFQSTVLIYGLLGLFDEAVTTALEHGDIELAKINADKAESNPDLRKSLWLKIAKHIIMDLKDVNGGIALLQQCELLKIEDLLPFFPDFVLIDDFKEEICTALEDYNVHIEEIKTEMDEATQSAHLLRQSIQDQKSKFMLVTQDEACNLCHQPVLTRQFYLFPCQHAFHSDCLVKRVSEYLKPSDKSKLNDLQNSLTRDIALLRALMTKGELDDDNLKRKENIDKLKEELDHMIASECCLCGDLMIKSIDLPLIKDSEFDLSLSWLI